VVLNPSQFKWLLGESMSQIWHTGVRPRVWGHLFSQELKRQTPQKNEVVPKRIQEEGCRMMLIDINGYNMYVIMYVICVYINIEIIVNYILYTVN